MNELFRQFAGRISAIMGSAGVFIAAVVVIGIWAISGPIFHFSDSWKLIINTSTTIITFLMVFLIQNTQNRDAKAIHLKLDELLRAGGDARNSLIDLENLTDEQLKRLQQQFQRLQQREEADPCVEPEAEAPPTRGSGRRRSA